MEEKQLTNEKNNNKEETKKEEKSLTMEIFEEQKRQNTRLNHIIWGLIALCGFIFAFGVTVVFLYLHSYDFSSTVEQEGVYAMLDSDGNVISSDINPEQIIEIMEILNNGNTKNNKEKN